MYYFSCQLCCVEQNDPTVPRGDHTVSHESLILTLLHPAAFWLPAPPPPSLPAFPLYTLFLCCCVIMTKLHEQFGYLPEEQTVTTRSLEEEYAEATAAKEEVNY